MLVLSRKVDEQIVIGENITITIISGENGSVRLGIDAPRDLKIFRKELLDNVKELNIASSKEIDIEAISNLSKILKK